MNGKGQRIGYIRVSTAEQNTARQLDGIELDRTFTDHASGKSIERPALSEALAYLREGDTLTVHSIDRLARNTKQLLEIVETLNARGITIEFVKNNLTFTASNNDHTAKLKRWPRSFGQFFRFLSGTLGGHAAVFIAGSIAK
jgi:DNA invertase Pin-like site-specific DNA recombinase